MSLLSAIKAYFTKPQPQGRQSGYQTGRLLYRYKHQPRFTINYREIEGAASTRTVRLRETRRHWNGDLVIVCWCELKSDVRTFRLDRIEAVTVDGVAQTPLYSFWHRTLEIDLPAHMRVEATPNENARDSMSLRA